MQADAKEPQVNQWVDAVLGVVAAFGPWAFVIAFVGMLFETSILIGLLIPGDSIVLLTSTTVRSAGGYFLLLAAVLAGSAAGESLGFLIGRHFGPRLRASRVGRRIGEQQWLRAERQLDRRGGITVFLSRFLPFLHALIPVSVGMSGMRYRRFMAWSLPACLLWGVIYISVGTAAGSGYRRLSGQLHTASWIFLGLIALFLLAVLGGKRLLHRVTEHPADRD